MRPLSIRWADPKETPLLSSIKRYLAIDRRVAWWARINTGKGKLLRPDGEARWIEFGFTGCSDILGQLKPRQGELVGALLAIEVKTHKGTVKPEQRAFLDKVAIYGGLAGIARDVRDVKELIDNWYKID